MVSNEHHTMSEVMCMDTGQAVECSKNLRFHWNTNFLNKIGVCSAVIIEL